jgi:hypothetical protein
MSNKFNISLSVVSSHPNLPSQPPLSLDRSRLFIAVHRPSRNPIGEDNPTKYAVFVAPRRRRRATTMGQQRGNAHQQAKTMSYQQCKFLQLVQGLAPHRPFSIFRTYQPLVIVVIAIAADAPFGNRDEAAPMGGVMADVKGDVWMQRRRLGAAGGGGGGRRRQRRGERGGDYGPVQSQSMALVPT